MTNEPTLADAKPSFDQIIDLVGALGRAAYYLLDSCETSGPVGEEVHTIEQSDIDHLSDVLDRIEALPFEEPGFVLGPGAMLQVALRKTAPADDKDATIARLTAERDRQKNRGDNHWETLRGIRHIAETSGDLERIIQWVDDAWSGYTDTPENTLAEACDQRNEALTRAEKAEAALSQAHDAGFREGVEAAWHVARKVICSKDWTDCDGDVFCDKIKAAMSSLSPTPQADPGADKGDE